MFRDNRTNLLEITRSVDFTNGNLSTPTLVQPTSVTMCGFARLQTSVTGSLMIIGGDNIGGPANSFAGLLFDAGSGNMDIFSSDITSASLKGVGLNLWYFWAWTGNGVTAIGYNIDSHGTLTTATPATGIVSGTPQNMNISNDDESDGNWAGLIAGAKVFNYPMSAREIRLESQQLAPVSQRGLVSYLPMRGGYNPSMDLALGGQARWTKTGTFATGIRSPPVPEILTPRRLFISPNPGTPTNPTDAIFFGMT